MSNIALTLRLSQDQASDLAMLGLILDKPAAEIIRRALAAYTEPYRQEVDDILAALAKTRKPKP